MTSISLINKKEKKNVSLKVFGSASSSFPWHFPLQWCRWVTLTLSSIQSHHYPSHGTWLMAFCLGTSITIQSASSITASLQAIYLSFGGPWPAAEGHGRLRAQMKYSSLELIITAIKKKWKRDWLLEKDEEPLSHRGVQFVTTSASVPLLTYKKHVDSLCLFK